MGGGVDVDEHEGDVKGLHWNCQRERESVCVYFCLHATTKNEKSCGILTEKDNVPIYISGGEAIEKIM